MKQDSFHMTQNFSSGIVAVSETKAKAALQGAETVPAARRN